MASPSLFSGRNLTHGAFPILFDLFLTPDALQRVRTVNHIFRTYVLRFIACSLFMSHTGLVNDVHHFKADDKTY
jgi:hypothetical protein